MKKKLFGKQSKNRQVWEEFKESWRNRKKSLECVFGLSHCVSRTIATVSTHKITCRQGIYELDTCMDRNFGMNWALQCSFTFLSFPQLYNSLASETADCALVLENRFVVLLVQIAKGESECPGPRRNFAAGTRGFTLEEMLSRSAIRLKIGRAYLCVTSCRSRIGFSTATNSPSAHRQPTCCLCAVADCNSCEKYKFCFQLPGQLLFCREMRMVRREYLCE